MESYLCIIITHYINYLLTKSLKYVIFKLDIASYID